MIIHIYKHLKYVIFEIKKRQKRKINYSLTLKDRRRKKIPLINLNRTLLLFLQTDLTKLNRQYISYILHCGAKYFLHLYKNTSIELRKIIFFLKISN